MPAQHIAEVLVREVTLISIFDPTTRNALIGVEWSIFVEFLFYFMFPFVLAWLITAPWSMVAVTAILMWPPVCEAITTFLGIQQPNFTIFWHFHSFLTGMLVYRLLITDEKQRPTIGSALFLVAIGLSIAAVSKHENGFSVSAVSLAAACTIAAAHYGSPLVIWLRWKPLTLAGQISFSIYLLHPLVMGAVGEFGFLTPIQAAIALGLTLAAAYCSYRLVEMPAQNFAKRLISRWPERPVIVD